MLSSPISLTNISDTMTLHAGSKNRDGDARSMYHSSVLYIMFWELQSAARGGSKVGHETAADCDVQRRLVV
jgi:hypothetical protein